MLATLSGLQSRAIYMAQSQALVHRFLSAWQSSLNVRSHVKRSKSILLSCALVACIADVTNLWAQALDRVMTNSGIVDGDIVASVVASDDAAMVSPADRTDSLTAIQIEQMVRLAVERIGGMALYVPADASLVALKPNVTIPRASGSGVITDSRVVRAVALLVHEVAPKAKIMISEATAGWLHPSLQDCSAVDIRGSIDIVDGWEISGYYPILDELRARGIDVDVHDLSFDALDTLVVEGGGMADDEYILPHTITRADAWINLPVAKPHGAKMTGCLKNRFGILPGAVYGWDRASGTDQHDGIDHVPQIVDETFVDLLSVETEDLCICDMIRNVEGGAFSGSPRRSNLIVAGSDPVGTDLVIARLMGFNPDDMEYAENAWQRGLGPRFIERVRVDGDLEALTQRFMKAGSDYGGGAWTQHADYGMGPRRWTILGPLPRDHRFSDAERRQLQPRAGQDGWSDIAYFSDDRIDLDRYFDDPVNRSAYAWTTFAMATSDSVRYWIGSDDALTVWIDGEQIYTHEGRRNHRLGGDRIPGFVEAGEHALLVRAEQGRGRFDFSINICEPIDDKRYAGNRYPGIRYGGETIERQVDARSLPPVDYFDDGWQPSTKHEITIDGLLAPELTSTIPDSVYVAISPARSTRFLDALASISGVEPMITDSSANAAFHSAHAWFARMPINHDWYPEDWPGITRYFDWVGLKYGISYGFGHGEALQTMKSWLAQGYAAMIPGIDDGHAWIVVNGYRETASGLQLHTLRTDASGVDVFGWVHTDEWGGSWGHLINRSWALCPVIVATPNVDEGAPSLVDEWAYALVQKATEASRREVGSGDWGKRYAAVGLAAWDDWVIEWERYPWTREWATQEEIARAFREIGDLYEHIADRHGGSGRYFTWAADQETDEHRAALLRTAATGYLEIERLVRQMETLLPTQMGSLDEDGERQLAQIPKMRDLPRQARTAVRSALGALVELIDAKPLPPVQQDPLRHREDGILLLHFRAGSSKGIHHLTLRGETVEIKWYHGRKLDDVEHRVERVLPAKPGWNLVVEPIEGYGMYTVVEQPSADNDWTTRVLIDDEWTPYTNSVEFVLWAIPADL
ncbi:MAG: DUF362 domain-containing protein [Gemmatimonadetes bacterium]|nr:DUF362 domain-containing protein [Gemmatimonadota bacterium]